MQLRTVRHETTVKSRGIGRAEADDLWKGDCDIGDLLADRGESLCQIGLQVDWIFEANREAD